MKLREKIFYLSLYQLDSLCLQITHNPCNVGSISRMPIEALYEDLPVGNRFLFGCFTRGYRRIRRSIYGNASNQLQRGVQSLYAILCVRVQKETVHPCNRVLSKHTRYLEASHVIVYLMCSYAVMRGLYCATQVKSFSVTRNVRYSVKSFRYLMHTRTYFTK